MKFDLEHYGPGRPPLPETRDRMKQMLKAIQKEPGIQSAKLARQLGISSLECSTLAKRLAKRGFITIGHHNRSLTYSLAEAVLIGS